MNQETRGDVFNADDSNEEKVAKACAAYLSNYEACRSEGTLGTGDLRLMFSAVTLVRSLSAIADLKKPPKK